MSALSSEGEFVKNEAQLGDLDRKSVECVPSSPSAGVPAASDEAQLAARSCVLAKFLGFLLFSPQWAMVHSRALGDDTRAAAAEASPLAPRGGLDICAIARAAAQRGRLQLCLPWIMCFLQVRQGDKSLAFETAVLYAATTLCPHSLRATGRRLHVALKLRLRARISSKLRLSCQIEHVLTLCASLALI